MGLHAPGQLGVHALPAHAARVQFDRVGVPAATGLQIAQHEWIRSARAQREFTQAQAREAQLEGQGQGRRRMGRAGRGDPVHGDAACAGRLERHMPRPGGELAGHDAQLVDPHPPVLAFDGEAAQPEALVQRPFDTLGAHLHAGQGQVREVHQRLQTARAAREPGQGERHRRQAGEQRHQHAHHRAPPGMAPTRRHRRRLWRLGRGRGCGLDHLRRPGSRRTAPALGCSARHRPRRWRRDRPAFEPARRGRSPRRC